MNSNDTHRTETNQRISYVFTRSQAFAYNTRRRELFKVKKSLRTYFRETRRFGSLDPIITSEYLLPSQWVPVLFPTWLIPLWSEYPFALY